MFFISITFYVLTKFKKELPLHLTEATMKLNTIILKYSVLYVSNLNDRFILRNQVYFSIPEPNHQSAQHNLAPSEHKFTLTIFQLTPNYTYTQTYKQKQLKLTKKTKNLKRKKTRRKRKENEGQITTSILGKINPIISGYRNQELHYQ